jgi:hypothetical protein
VKPITVRPRPNQPRPHATPTVSLPLECFAPGEPRPLRPGCPVPSARPAQGRASQRLGRLGSPVRVGLALGVDMGLSCSWLDVACRPQLFSWKAVTRDALGVASLRDK